MEELRDEKTERKRERKREGGREGASERGGIKMRRGTMGGSEGVWRN